MTILFRYAVQADDFMSSQILGEERYHRVN